MADDNYEQYCCDVSDACAEHATIVYHASVDAIGSHDHVTVSTMTTAARGENDDESRRPISSSWNHVTTCSKAPPGRYSGLFVDVGGNGLLPDSCQTSTMSLNDILDMDADSVDSLTADFLLSDRSSFASSQWTSEFDQLCQATSISIPSVSDSDDIVDVEMNSRLERVTFDDRATDQPSRDNDDKSTSTACCGGVTDDLSACRLTSARSDDGESVFADHSSPSSGSVVEEHRGCSISDAAADAQWLTEQSQSLASASPSCSTDDGYWTHSPVSVRVTTEQEVFGDHDDPPRVTTLPTAEEHRDGDVASAVVTAAIGRLCDHVQLSGTNDVEPAAVPSVTKDMVGALTAYFESIHSEFHRPDTSCPQCQSSIVFDVTKTPHPTFVVPDPRPVDDHQYDDHQCDDHQCDDHQYDDHQCDVVASKPTCDHSSTSPTSPVDDVIGESDLHRHLSSRRVVSLPNVSSDASGRMSTSSASSVLRCHVTGVRSHSLQSFDSLLRRAAAERRKLRSSNGDVAATRDSDPVPTSPRLTPDMIMKYTIQGHRDVPDGVKRTATAIVYPIGIDRNERTGDVRVNVMLIVY